MGIPANEKCMLLRVGANKEVMLTWIMWSVSSKSGRSQRREREREGKSDENGSVVSIFLFVITLISLHSCHCVSLSYRGCVQVKLQICGRRVGLESSIPQSQLTWTSRGLQTKPQMRNLQRWGTVAFNKLQPNIQDI